MSYHKTSLHVESTNSTFDVCFTGIFRLEYFCLDGSHSCLQWLVHFFSLTFHEGNSVI